MLGAARPEWAVQGLPSLGLWASCKVDQVSHKEKSPLTKEAEVDAWPCSVRRTVLLGQLWVDVTVTHSPGVPPRFGNRAARRTAALVTQQERRLWNQKNEIVTVALPVPALGPCTSSSLSDPVSLCSI